MEPTIQLSEDKTMVIFTTPAPSIPTPPPNIDQYTKEQLTELLQTAETNLIILNNQITAAQVKVDLYKKGLAQFPVEAQVLQAEQIAPVQ